MERGYFIAIEGTDKSGKETQADLLAKNFVLNGFQVVQLDFPDYNTPTGIIISQILNDLHDVHPTNHPLELQALMAINRYEQQERIEHALMSGKIVIADRYWASGLVYGMAAGLDETWLKTIHHSLVKPDITILLDIDEPTYLARCKNYDTLDINEKNLDLINTCRKLYLQLAEENKWILQFAVGTPEEISKILFAKVESQLDIY